MPTFLKRHLKVNCLRRKECSNPDCMHYGAHRKVLHPGGLACDNEITICPLINKIVLCRAVREVSNASYY